MLWGYERDRVPYAECDLILCVCCKVAELEAHGGHGPSDLLKDELTQSLEELEALLKAKDEVGTFDCTVIVLLYLESKVEHSDVHGRCTFYSFPGNPHFAE